MKRIHLTGVVACGDKYRVSYGEEDNGAIFINETDLVDEVAEHKWSEFVRVILNGKRLANGQVVAETGWGYSEYTAVDEDQVFIGHCNLLSELEDLEGSRVDLIIEDYEPTEHDQWQRELDKDSDNPQLRSIYGDWLLEKGSQFCETQWWMARNDCFPGYSPGPSYEPPGWKLEKIDARDAWPSLQSPLKVATGCEPVSSNHFDEIRFVTRVGAEIALHNALVSSDLINAQHFADIEDVLSVT